MDVIHARAPVVLEGSVFDPQGAPAEGAVVVSSAGGRAVADASGRYRIEVRVPAAARELQLTVVGAGAGQLVARTSVELSEDFHHRSIAPFVLAQETCPPSWLPTFGGLPGTQDTVRALTVFDEGNGPALYIGGSFTIAGGVNANRVARWDGSSWAPLGSGMNDHVLALAVYDAGGGPALYAAGEFTTAGGVTARRIARWNGTSWTSLGSGSRNGTDDSVVALTVYDDGSGPALYAAGEFTAAGGSPANRIAKWNGSSWTAVGTGTNGAVLDLTVYDDGSGPALYAAGLFTTAGGSTANRIAKWNGASWTALGSGTNSYTAALAVHDDGSGPSLYAGGTFTTAGGSPANRIAKWNGTSWAAVGSGTDGTVSVLAVHDDGSGPSLYAGGTFTTAGGSPANRIAKWDGTTWSALGSGADGGSSILALATYDGGGGPVLFAGGSFWSAGGVAATCVATWDGSGWSSLGGNVNSTVRALAVFDDGSGPALHAGGSFTHAGSEALNRIGKWNGTSWAALGSGMDSAVQALAVHDDGGGSALFAGGSFTVAGGTAANRIARWDGSSWSPLGSGVEGAPPGLFTAVRDLVVYDDGGGPALYVAGCFTTAGGVAANHIARWDGSSWSPLGEGLSDEAYSLTVHDDGSGSALYVGGSFTFAGGAVGVQALGIAKWNGSSWSALDSGMNGTGVPLALASFDDGSGQALYAGGTFTHAGGLDVHYIARWDGSSWSPLAGGTSFMVLSLTAHDDGSGRALYVGGRFVTAGGLAALGIAKWDGSSWSALGGGMDAVFSLLRFDDGIGPALYAAGELAVDSGDYWLARWGCLDSMPPVLSCPPSVIVHDPLTGPPGEIVTFTVTATDDRDPSPVVVCVPPPGSFFPGGTTMVTCTATDASGNLATCEFPVTVQLKLRRE